MTRPVPVPPRHPHVHSEHGLPRPDDYAWMRQGGPALHAHLLAERDYYEAAIEPLRPLVAELAAEASARAPSGIIDGFETEAGQYFVERRDGRSVLTRATRADPDPMVVLDPATAPGLDGSFPDALLPSPDDRLIAYALDRTGREECELRVLQIATGTQEGATVHGVTDDFAWSADSAALVYLRRDRAWRPSEAWLHRLGGDPADDRLILTEPDRYSRLMVRLSRDRTRIVLTSSSRITRRAWTLDAAEVEGGPVPATPHRHGVQFDAEPAPDGGLLVVSDLGFREFRLWYAPPGELDPTRWRAMTAPEEQTRVLGVEAFGDRLVLRCRRDGAALLRLLSWPDGRCVAEIAPRLPGGSVRLLPTSRREAGTVTIVEESYVHPPRWSRWNLATGALTPSRQVTTSHDPGGYRSERRTIRAADGAEIPVTLVRHADTPLDGSAPALLSTYGAYESCFEPSFDPVLPSLLDRGVVFVHAHVRGGGERGRRWWLQGRLDAKENTFGDLFAVADALAGTAVDGRRMASRGMSAGGLVQGVALTRRPERWRAIIAEVPWVDVVSSMCDESVPLTIGERDEWGDPRRIEEFRWMLAYSPYDRLPPAGGRPALLVTGAVNDSRVLVHEPAKWVAALRHSDPAWGPRCLFRCEVGAGSHSGPQSADGRIGYEAELLAWTLAQLEVGTNRAPR